MPVQFKPAAVKDLAGLDAGIAGRIRVALTEYDRTASGDVKRLKGSHDVLRLRVGDYRVLMTNNAGLIDVLRIRHRREVYR